MIKLVSSANKTILLLLLLVEEGKSFMYRRKSKGPSIDTLIPAGNIYCVSRVGDCYLHVSHCQNSSATFGRRFVKIFKGLS
jgi:hypothetical protein